MSDDYYNDDASWCDEHAVIRELCGCAFHDPRGPLWDRILNRAQLAKLPEPQPLIHQTLDRRTVALLAGSWSSGKTFLALDWSLCIATGKPWQGREVHQGSVVYVAAEGAYGLNKRVHAWEVAWQHEVQDESFYVVPQAVEIANKNVAHLVSVCKEIRPQLVVVDTVARCAVGLDENSAKDAGLFVRGLDRVRDSLDGGTVLAVHHTGKDGKTVRGSSAIEGAMDTVYQLDGDGRLMNLHRTKRKDGPTPDQHTFTLEEVPGTESVVVSVSRGADTTPSVQRIMSTFVQLFEHSGATKSELRSAVDMASSSFFRGVNRALEQGFLVNTGTDQRPFYRLGTGYE